MQVWRKMPICSWGTRIESYQQASEIQDSPLQDISPIRYGFTSFVSVKKQLHLVDAFESDQSQSN